MTDPRPLFQDTILLILKTALRDLTVERIRSQLAKAGSVAGKDEVVRALAHMKERQLELGVTRRWVVRHDSMRAERVRYVTSSASDEYLVSIPCQAVAGEEVVVEPEMLV